MLRRLNWRVILFKTTTPSKTFQWCLTKSIKISSPSMKIFETRHYNNNSSIICSSNVRCNNSSNYRNKSKCRWLEFQWLQQIHTTIIIIMIDNNTSNVKSSNSATTFSSSAKINNLKGTSVAIIMLINQTLLTIAPWWIHLVIMPVRLIIEWAWLVSRQRKGKHNHHSKRNCKMLHS